MCSELMEELISKDIKTSNVLLILLSAVLIPLMASIPFMMNSYENNVAISVSGIEVNGVGGFELGWEKVSSISMVEDLPQVQGRSKTLKGDFKALDGSTLKMVVNGDSPYIKVHTGGFDVYINRYYSDQTKEIFAEMQNGYESYKKQKAIR